MARMIKHEFDPKAQLENRVYQDDKPLSCRYCYWWNHKKCQRLQCAYLIPEAKTNPEKKEPEKKSCCGCSYGKHKPCIGYCIAQLYQEMKENRKKVTDCRMK